MRTFQRALRRNWFAPGEIVRRTRAQFANSFSGDGYRRQGRRRQGAFVWFGPGRPPNRQLQSADKGGARPRFPLARSQSDAKQRYDWNLEPVALRRCLGGARPETCSQKNLESALRSDQRFRENPDAEWHDYREDHAPYLQRRA